MAEKDRCHVQLRLPLELLEWIEKQRDELGLKFTTSTIVLLLSQLRRKDQKAQRGKG